MALQSSSLLCVSGASSGVISLRMRRFELDRRSSALSGIRKWRCGAEEETDADFETRLAKLQRKATSGTGKKAELRKARKEGVLDSYAAAPKISSAKEIFIPPVQLTDPVSDGLVVQLGFEPYTERLNGRLAALGLAAVLLVELASGERFLTYHNNSTLVTQAYFMLSAAALFIKYEKERKNVWPKDDTSQ